MKGTPTPLGEGAYSLVETQLYLKSVLRSKKSQFR